MKNLRALRMSRGESQQGLAEKAGITQTAISQIEAGQHDPKFSTILRLSMALGVDPEELIGSACGPKAPAAAAGRVGSHA